MGVMYLKVFLVASVVVGRDRLTSPKALSLVPPLLHLVLVDKPDEHRIKKVSEIELSSRRSSPLTCDPHPRNLPDSHANDVLDAEVVQRCHVRVVTFFSLQYQLLQDAIYQLPVLRLLVWKEEQSWSGEGGATK